MEGVHSVLLDIEGTICPISFVKDTLFPYALEALPEVLSVQWQDKAFQPYRDAFPKNARTSPAALEAHVKDLTQRDVKVAYLKDLQGYLWEDGYRTGAYSTPLFADVGPQLKAWKDAGIQLAIYSSGSIFAQKLLFEHVHVDESAKAGMKRTAAEAVESSAGAASEPAVKRSKVAGKDDPEKTKQVKPNGQAGEAPSEATTAQTEDLRDLIAEGAWFDTTNAGPKTEASSFNKILAALKWAPARTLFLTDSVKEVDAATEAGLKTMLLVRPGNAAVTEGDRARIDVVHNLHEVELSPAPKTAITSNDPLCHTGQPVADGKNGAGHIGNVRASDSPLAALADSKPQVDDCDQLFQQSGADS